MYTDLLLVIYVTANFYLFLSTSLDKKFDHYCIVGDFNCPNISWCDSDLARDNSRLVVWSFYYSLIQHVNQVTGPASNNILDLLFTSSHTTVSDIQICESFGSSDHLMVTFNLDISVHPSYEKNESKKLTPVYEKANWKHFNSLLQSNYWASMLAESDVNTIWKTFVTAMTDTIKNSIPFRNKSNWSPRHRRYV